MTVDVSSLVESVTQDKNGKMIIVSVSEKKPISHRVCKEDYAWNPSTCTYYKCDKDWEIGKYLNECECMKSLVDNLAVTRDKIVDTPDSVLINPSDGIDYWLITALLTIAGLLLLVVIVVKQQLKPGLTIPCLLY